MNMRIGQGYDAHRFQSGDAVVLGGVTIPFDRSLAAHSDGDVLLHAICDALLGAAALGDIGRHFPDSDPTYKGVDSRVLLRAVRDKLAAADWRVVNIDATVIAERPKIAPHVATMIGYVASDLGITVDRVNVKGAVANASTVSQRASQLATFGFNTGVLPGER